eukprot:203176_1
MAAEFFDDPTAIPHGKMSFGVFQYKDASKTTKWNSVKMGFAYLQDGTLWLEWAVDGCLYCLPKKWTECATTAARKKEMMEFHHKYKYLVSKWIWEEYWNGLKGIYGDMANKICKGDIAVTGRDESIKFIEINKIIGQGVEYEAVVLDHSVSRTYATNQTEMVCHEDIQVLMKAQDRDGLTDGECLFRCIAFKRELDLKSAMRDARSVQKQSLMKIRFELSKILKQKKTGRRMAQMEITNKAFYQKNGLKQYIQSKIKSNANIQSNDDDDIKSNATKHDDDCEWKIYAKYETIQVTNEQLGRVFGRRYLKHKISKDKKMEVEDGYSHFRFNKGNSGCKSKIYLSSNIVETVKNVVAKGSQRLRNETRAKQREQIKLAKQKQSNSNNSNR